MTEILIDLFIELPVKDEKKRKKPQKNMVQRISLAVFHCWLGATVEPLYSTIGGVHEMRSCYRRIVLK